MTNRKKLIEVALPLEAINKASAREFDGDAHRVHYIRQPFHREPDFGVTSVNYDFSDLLSRATLPS